MLSTRQNGSVVLGVSLQFKALQHKLKKIERLRGGGGVGVVTRHDTTSLPSKIAQLLH